MRGSVGTGRRARLRILWWQHRVGSSPIFRIRWKVRKPWNISGVPYFYVQMVWTRSLYFCLSLFHKRQNGVPWYKLVVSLLFPLQFQISYMWQKYQNKNAVQRIESGKRFVTNIEWKAFAEIFDISSDELLKYIDETIRWNITIVPWHAGFLKVKYKKLKIPDFLV